jgi:deoxyribonuclease-1-like protein
MRKIGTLLILIAAIGFAYYVLTYEERPASDEPSQATPIDEPAATGAARSETEVVELVTWNLLNFGKSKDEDEMTFIADLLRDYDVVAVQEVNTGPDGAQAVARLDADLDRRGAQWDYVVSDPTSGEGSERYAYLWKPSRVRLLGRAWLEASLADDLDREPYLARFETRLNRQQMLVASFHAVPTAKRPADEVAFLDDLHRRYENDHLLILGDFNLSQKHEAWDELKTAGYQPILVDQKTSLRMRRKDGEHLSSEYDNIFYEVAPLHAGPAGVVDFTGEFRTLRQAREISDHLPVFMEVQWK